VAQACHLVQKEQRPALQRSITLTMIYQSIGQMRETYGGRDAESKWFESASWISFAAINDPETADYISRRCGMTTVEI
ncbi:type IV secretory system conjugative DNA transfer family protein, partial [Rhizobium ruizarguesonis]